MKNIIETIAGTLVLIIAVGFVIFAYKSAGIKPNKQGYTLIARFERADGIIVGSDVQMSGIKIGNVSKQTLDPKTYLAVLEITIDKSIQLPKDSSVQIVSDGLLGGKYLSLSPGADNDMLASGDEIHYTQSSVNIESLIGKMIFNSADKKSAN